MSACVRVSAVCVVYTWRSEDNSRESTRLPPCQFRGSNPGRHAWLQAPVPAQPPLRQLLISRSSSVPPGPSGHLPAQCEPARERQVRAVPSRHAHRAAPRTRRDAPLSRGARRAPEGQVSSASGGRRGGATRGSPDLWAARETKAARGRASRRRAEGTLERSAGRSASHAGPRPPARPVHATPGKPREGRQKRDREHGAGSRVRRSLARAPHPRGHGARTCRRRLRRRCVPRSASLRRARPAQPAQQAAAPSARSVAQPRAGHRRRRLAAPASRLVRRAAPAVVPPPPASGPASHRAAGLSIRPQKARGLSLCPSRLVAAHCLCK